MILFSGDAVADARFWSWCYQLFYANYADSGICITIMSLYYIKKEEINSVNSAKMSIDGEAVIKWYTP